MFSYFVFGVRGDLCVLLVKVFREIKNPAFLTLLHRFFKVGGIRPRKAFCYAANLIFRNAHHLGDVGKRATRF
jgi:hypothetical protein